MKNLIKNKGCFLLCGLLVIAIILANIPITAYAAIYNRGYELFAKYINMTEDEIYKSKMKDTGKNLLSEIKDMEKNLTVKGDEIALLPHAMALIEKRDEFSQDEIINLLKDVETGVVLESALIRMYLDKNADKDELLSLIDNSELNKESKEYIVALSDLSSDELKDIYYKYNDSVAIVTMKKLMTSNPVMAFDIASDVLMSNTQNITDEQLISSFLGLGEYYSKYTGDKEQKDKIIGTMKDLFNTSQSEIVKDNIIYSMARMNDFEVFKYIIDSENIDTALKISAIERNIDLLVEKASTEASEEDLSCIESAMKIHPILEVGEALKTISDKGFQTKSLDLSEIIKYIENNGIKGVLKNE